MPGGGLLGTLFQSHSEVLVSVACDPSIGAPELRLRMKRTDLVYVLKVKVEVALAHLVPRVGAVADGISLEYRGLVLKDMKPLDAYSITDTSELSCALVPVPLERDLVPADAEFDHLDALVRQQQGVASSGTVKKIVMARGERCQVCWRRRWFRAEILAVYATSMLLKWSDWEDSEWPHFFIRLALPTRGNEVLAASYPFIDE